ncbi:MAG TPA: Gfo/Idh/MocA family oxidoreductase [Candidatus Limnocylindrales bacterium]|nr:Gfo/Idh/MocA family oxidoreductase [Candidatus Limnocylindrales bacterium]
MKSTRAATRIALIGANGHGLHHRRHIGSLGSLVELVGLCDVLPVTDVPTGAQVFTDVAEMLKMTEPEVVIVCTPPRTHVPFALSALESGADVLLEKPPVLDLTEHDLLQKAVARTDRVVQVGFQGLGSSQLPELRTLARTHKPCDISIIGSWQRDDVYWSRSPWAGHLPVDGALRNPFAHYTMQALAIAGSDPIRMEVAWCRVRDIEVDDTATLRLTLANGSRVLIAVTLAGEDMIDGVMSVGGQRHNFRELVDRSLLLNLIEFRSGSAPLLAPLSATRGFTAIVEALGRMPMPGRLDQSVFDTAGPVRTLRGVNAVLRRCAREFALLSEIDGGWTATSTGGVANIG